MATRIVQHAEDPGIAVELTERVNGVPGWSGPCTECGRIMHQWNERAAAEVAQRHVDRHESSL